jgi:hypothetical protein
VGIPAAAAPRSAVAHRLLPGAAALRQQTGLRAGQFEPQRDRVCLRAARDRAAVDGAGRQDVRHEERSVRGGGRRAAFRPLPVPVVELF